MFLCLQNITISVPDTSHESLSAFLITIDLSSATEFIALHSSLDKLEYLKSCLVISKGLLSN